MIFINLSFSVNSKFHNLLSFIIRFKSNNFFILPLCLPPKGEDDSTQNNLKSAEICLPSLRRGIKGEDDFILTPLQTQSRFLLGFQMLLNFQSE